MPEDETTIPVEVITNAITDTTPDPASEPTTFTFEKLLFEWAARLDDWSHLIRLNTETSNVSAMWLANSVALGVALTPEVDMVHKGVTGRGQLFAGGGIFYEPGVGSMVVTL